MTTTTSKGSADLSGLREQILANAIHAFPTIVEDYMRQHNTTDVKPNDIFDIVVCPVHGSSPVVRAILTFRIHVQRRVAFITDTETTVVGVLATLLGETGELACQKLVPHVAPDLLVGPLRRCGVVDKKLRSKMGLRDLA